MSWLADNLERVHEELNAAGFVIGTAHHIDAQRVVDTLERSGLDTSDAARLAPFLAPIYCASEEQQREFPGLLARVWGSPSPRPSVPDREQELASIAARIRRRSYLAWGIGFAVVAAIVSILIYLWVPWAIHGNVTTQEVDSKPARVSATHRFTSPTEDLTDGSGNYVLYARRIDLPVTVTASKPGFVSSGAVVEGFDDRKVDIRLDRVPEKVEVPGQSPTQWERSASIAPYEPSSTNLSRQRRSEIRTDRLAMLLAPGLLAVAWLVYWMVRRRAWLSRLPGQTPRNVREMSASGRRSLSLILGWRDVGYELRRRLWVTSAELNVDATLDSMLRESGRPRLVFGSRTEPEYIALIDEASDSDHLAKLGDQLMLTFETRDVSVQRFFFRDDPALCEGPARARKPRSAPLPVVELDDLLTRFRDHRFILVSDGRALFDKLTGRPRATAYLLAAARDVVVLTPSMPESWGRREWALSALGFTVLPLSPGGVVQLGELYGSQKPVKSPGAAEYSRLPSRWTREPMSMLMPYPPGRLTPAAVCEMLRKDLGPTSFRLLQVASVYPEIHWGMTVRVGAEVLTARQLAESLPRIAQLPWFRHGHMPSWLREELLRTLPEGSWVAAQSTIRSILEKSRQGSGGEIPLRIAAPPAVPWWRRMMPVPDGGKGVRLRRDAVFLRFMQGPRKLSVPAVEAIRRLFFRDGVWAQGVRLVPILTVAAAAMIFLGRQWPIHELRNEIVESKTAGPPSVLAIAPTGSSTAPFVVSYSNGDFRRIEGDQAAPLAAPFEGPISRLTYFGKGVLLAQDESDVSAQIGAEIGDIQTRPYAVLRSESVLVFKDGKPELSILVNAPLCASITRDGSTLTTVSAEKIRRFNLSAGGVRTMPAPEAPETVTYVGCTVQYDGNFIVAWGMASGGFSRLEGLWRIDLTPNPRVTHVLAVRPGPPISRVVASIDATFAVARGSTLEVYRPDQPLNPEIIPASSSTLAMLDDGSQIAVATANGAVDVWKSNRPQPVTVTPQPEPQIQTQNPPVTAPPRVPPPTEVVNAQPSTEQRQVGTAQPKIAIQSGSRAVEGEPYELMAIVQSGDSSSGIGKATLSLNGSLVATWLGTELKNDGEITERMPLKAGSNLIRIEAANSSNTARAEEAKLVFVSSLKEPAATYLLTAGVANYESPVRDLRYPVADASGFRDAFKRANAGLYRLEEFHLPNPSREEFMRALSAMAQETRPQDVLVIFFAGYRTEVKLNAALAFRNYRGQPPHGLVYFDEINSVLRRTEAQNIVILLDACPPVTEQPSEVFSNTPINYWSLNKNLVVLEAASDGEVAHESDQLGHGFLTYALIEELRRRSGQRDDVFIDTESFTRSVSVRVEDLAQKFKYKRTATTTIVGNNFILLPAASPAAQSK